MTRYTLSPLARTDLDHIWEHTSKRWDEDRAETYLRMIQAAIDAVAANPKLGRLRTHGTVWEGRVAAKVRTTH